MLKDILEGVVDEKYYLSDKMVECLMNRKKTESYSPCKFRPIEEPYRQKSRTINHRIHKMGDADNYISAPCKGNELSN